MVRETKCKVVGCESHAHAKGYCNRHYGQIRRNGKIYVHTEGDAARKAGMQFARHEEETYRMRALGRELQRAEMMYSNVVGLEGRLKWRREIEDVKKEMIRLGVPIPHSGTEKQTSIGAAVGF